MDLLWLVTSMYCTQCGTELSEADRYCSTCGQAVGATPLAPPSFGRKLTTLPGPDGVTVELARFGLRLGGFAIDLLAGWAAYTAFVTIGMFGYFAIAGFPEPVASESGTPPDDGFFQLIMAIYLVVVVGAFIGGLWFNSVGWSPGKRAVGIRIVRSDGTAPGWGRGIGRTLGVMVSWMPLVLGFLWAAWDERGQTWHDKIAGTYVVRADSVGAHHERGTGPSSLH